MVYKCYPVDPVESEELKRVEADSLGTNSLTRQTGQGGVRTSNKEPHFVEEGKSRCFSDTEEEESWAVMSPGVLI